MNTDRIREELEAIFHRHQQSGDTRVRIVSGELHKEVDFETGSHPNQMPSVCNVMHEYLGANDIVEHETPSGKSSTLTIVYRLPR